jgi:hypothetical protein
VLILKPMKTPVSWIAVLALSALAATAGSVVLQSPAGADPIGDCSTTTGEIVAVDFSAWGGDIERGCDAVLTTGYAALHRAGFTTAGDAQDGDAFICRIDDKPPPKQQSCGTTPPADAYWSYWHADVGQDTWTYSQQGAMGYHPPPGSVDAWTFGSTDIDGTTGQPTFSPESVRATHQDCRRGAGGDQPAVGGIGGPRSRRYRDRPGVGGRGRCRGLAPSPDQLTGVRRRFPPLER